MIIDRSEDKGRIEQDSQVVNFDISGREHQIQLEEIESQPSEHKHTENRIIETENTQVLSQSLTASQSNNVTREIPVIEGLSDLKN